MSEIDSSGAVQTPPAEQTQTKPPSTPADTGATEFRYGADAPEYLRGKSPQETVAWVTNLVDEVKTLVANRPQAQPPQQQRIMQDQNQNFALPDPDLAITDPKAYQTQLTNYLTAASDQRLAAYAQPILGQLATTARELSKNEASNKAIWEKYGADIDSIVAGVPTHLRTKELYDRAVVQVKGQRFDELAAEKAAALASAGTGLARSGGASADGGDDEPGDVWAKIESSPMGAAALKVAGKKGIRAAVASGAYKSLEHYAEMATKSKGRVDPANPSIVRSR